MKTLKLTIFVMCFGLALCMLLVGCGDLPFDDGNGDGNGDGDGDGNGEVDTVVPTLSEFAITSNNPTAYEVISFTLDGTDNYDVFGWLINESAVAPEPDDGEFVAVKPTTYTLSAGYEEKTVYAWAKDAAGNVSESRSFTVSFIEPGIEIWEIELDGGAAGVAFGLDVDPFDNIYVVGYTENGGAKDWWVKKFQPDGTEFSAADGWDKTIDSGSDDDIAYSVAVSLSNPYDVVIVGQKAGADWWVKRFEADGTEVTTGWDKTLDGNGQVDALYDVGFMHGTPDWLVAGYGGSVDTTIPSTSEDWWLSMFQDPGTMNTDWTDQKLDGGADGNDQARSLVVDHATGRIYFAGYSNDGTDDDLWIRKFYPWGTEFTDAEGWNKTLDAGGDERANGIAVDDDSNVYTVGSSGGDWTILTYDADGVAVAGWDKTFDLNTGDDAAMSVVAPGSRGVYVVGYGTNLTGVASGMDWSIKKFGADGTEVTLGWDKEFGGDGDDVAHDVAVDEDGENIYVIGYGTNLVSETSGQDWWIKKFFDDRP